MSFPPGGTADTLARLLADRLAKSHSWQSVVPHRTGGGVILQNSLKAAKPDGHTVGFGASYELTYPIGDRVQVDRLREFDALCSVAAIPVCIMTRPAAGLDMVDDWRRKAASGKAITFGVSPPFEWIGDRMSRVLKTDEALTGIVLARELQEEVQIGSTIGRKLRHTLGVASTSCPRATPGAVGALACSEGGNTEGLE